LLVRAEADHAARRDLSGYLVDRLAGKRNVMYEVKVRDIPARSLLCLLRHASNRQEVWGLGKEVIGMLKAQPPPRVDGVAGAAFLIYYGEVNQDSDGPVEFCWPVPQDLADQLAASFPRTHPAHRASAPGGLHSPAPGPADGGAVAAPLRLVNGLGGRAAAAAQ
jgi:hypothetical protein